MNQVSRHQRPSSLEQARRRYSLAFGTDDVAKDVFRMQKETREKVMEYISSGLQSSLSVDDAVKLSSGNTMSSDADELQVASFSKPTAESRKMKGRDSMLMSAWNGNKNPAGSTRSGVRRSYSSSAALNLPAASSSMQWKSDRDSSIALDGQTQATAMVTQPSASTVSAGIASRDARKVDSRVAWRNLVAASRPGTTKSDACQLPRSQSSASIEACGDRKRLNETVLLEDKPAASTASSLVVAPSALGTVSHRGGSNIVISKLSQLRNPSSNILDSKGGSSKLRPSRITAESKRREDRRSTSGIPPAAESSSGRSMLRPSQLKTVSSSLTNISAQITKSKDAAAVSDGTRLHIPKPSGILCLICIISCILCQLFQTFLLSLNVQLRSISLKINDCVILRYIFQLPAVSQMVVFLDYIRLLFPVPALCLMFFTLAVILALFDNFFNSSCNEMLIV